MLEIGKAEAPSASQEDIEWINRRIDRLNKKISLIIAVMIDKKIIGDELGKRIVQESSNDDDLIEWLMSTLKKE